MNNLGGGTLIKRHSQEIVSTNQDDPDEEEGVEDQDDEHWYLQIARFWWCNRTYYKGLSNCPLFHCQ